MKKILALLAATILSISSYAQPKSMTIKEFRALAEGDETECLLRGVVTIVKIPDRGSFYIKDETGEVLIFGINDDEGKQFKELDIRVGDTLTVAGTKTFYQRVVMEMKDALLVSKSDSPYHNKMENLSDEPDEYPKFRKKYRPEVFSKWVSSNLHYPDEARNDRCEGEVTVRFVIGKNGKITQAEVLNDVHPALEKEALRVVMKSPKWSPALKDNKPVNFSFTIPLIFEL